MSKKVNSPSLATASCVVSAGALLKLLRAVQSVVPAKPVVPILSNVLVEIDAAQQLRLTTSDLETMLTAGPMAVGASGALRICLPVGLLAKTLQGLGDVSVRLTVDPDTFAAELRSEGVGARSVFRMAGENPADFPRIPVQKAPVCLSLGTAQQALDALATVVPFANTDELRPAMMCVLFHHAADGLRLVTTDGHRLARFTTRAPVLSNDTLGQQYLLMAKTAALLLPWLSELVKPNTSQYAPNKPVVLELEAAMTLRVVLGDRVLVTRLLDERYPDYENVIPLRNPHVLTVGREALRRAVGACGHYANIKSHQLSLRLTAAGYTAAVLSAEDLDFSNEATVDVDGARYEGGDMTIGFNARFLEQVLGVLPGDELQAHLARPDRAALFAPVTQPESGNVLLLVMPVMLNSYV